MIKKTDIFVVIPVYNEERNIGKVVDEVKKYINNIVVVDDGSKDNTVKILKNKEIILVRYLVNIGKGSALKTGFDVGFKKGFKVGIMFDGDGQHWAGDLPSFIKKIGKGKKIVLGYRVFNGKTPFVRKFVNNLATLFVSVLYKVKIRDLTCGFRSISKDVFKKIEWRSDAYGVETEMVCRIAKNKLGFSQLPVQTIYKDNYKGVTILDALKVFFEAVYWRF